MKHLLWIACLLAGATLQAQEAVPLPAVNVPAGAVGQHFAFMADGPAGPGWSRPDEIARAYFDDDLPALFERTAVLTEDVPQHGKLDWIFTGPHAGFTVELTPSKVKVSERYYDSMALYTSGSYPERVVREDERQFTGHARRVTVVMDGHLAVRVLVNGVELLNVSCVFDVTRDQMVFAAPRTEHIGVSGQVLTPSVERSVVRLDTGVKHQTMLGFGGSPSIPAYERLSAAGKERYWELMRRYNLLLDREYPMGSELKKDLSNMTDVADATPHYYGDNFPNSEVSDFNYSKRAMALGGEVIYEMWALPPWAQVPWSTPGKPVLDIWNKPIKKAANPEEYARIVIAYCNQLKAATGHGPAIVGVQNEVEEPPEVFAEMTTTLRRELDKAGFQSTRIHMADTGFMNYGLVRVKDLKEHPEAWRMTDYTAAHEYDFQEFMSNPDLYDARLLAMHDASEGKPFLATEICLNDPHYQEPSYRIAFQVGQLYFKNLTELDAEALMYCWLLLDVEQPTFGGSRSLLVPNKMDPGMPIPSSFELRVMGAFSRHILKGMTRVNASSDDKDLLTTAFTDGTRTTLIVLNRSTESHRLQVDGATWKQVERVGATSDAAPVLGDVVVLGGEILTLSNFVAQ